MSAAASLEELPRLSPLQGALLAALVACAWLAVRVRILRRREARREPGDAPVPAARWLRALARSAAVTAVLAAVAAALAVAFAWTVVSS